MQLVGQHVIGRKDPHFAAIDQAAFASKNLFNPALYVTRQASIHQDMVNRLQSAGIYPDKGRATCK